MWILDGGKKLGDNLKSLAVTPITPIQDGAPAFLIEKSRALIPPHSCDTFGYQIEIHSGA